MGYSDQFKPAIQLGTPTTDQWADFFYATLLQDTVIEGEHLLRLGRGTSTEPGFNDIIQLKTPVANFAPNFREVQVTGKKGYNAICVEGGPETLGVFVYLTQTVVSGSDTEVHINSRYLPYAKLTDLVVPTAKDGPLELRLPNTGIAKLNVTLRHSPAGEPIFRTFKTEALFDDLTPAVIQFIENQLNFQSASISAYIGYQTLCANGQWPPSNASDEDVGLPTLTPLARAVLAGVLVTAGTVTKVYGMTTDNSVAEAVGEGLLGAVVVLEAWQNIAGLWAAPAAAPPPPPAAAPVGAGTRDDPIIID